ncbi:MAG: carbohydrate kinase [Coriobacteriales bacterium]|nr:carbohydrate kinase [Coriobacteriales bacterium]
MCTSGTLVCMGELLVDFSATTTDEAGRVLYTRNPGGAPANVAAAASKLGLSVMFIGKVGADALGTLARDALAATGVNVDHVIADRYTSTTLAFVDIDPMTAERSFSFSRKPGADTQLRPEDISTELATGCRALHVGSVSLSAEPVRSATFALVDAAQEAGRLISFDPNYRASLWPSKESAKDEIKRMMSRAQIVKLSLEEAQMLVGSGEDLQELAYAILAMGPHFVAITLGNEGAFLSTRTSSSHVDSFTVHALDTTGAGDVFWGATLAWLLGVHEVRTVDDLDILSDSDLRSCGRYACAAASVSVERMGGMLSAPTAREVAERLVAEA